MVKSFRITIRFNPEYDSQTIQSIKSINSRERSKILRSFIREEFKKSDKINHALSDAKKETKQPETKQVSKWNFPT